MASSLSIAALVLVAYLAVFAYTQEDGGPTEGETEICQEAAQASGKELQEAVKDRRYSCNIICRYTDGTEETKNSPDQQRCCDVGGGMPTGFCQNGTCPVGGGNGGGNGGGIGGGNGGGIGGGNGGGIGGIFG